MRVRPLLLLLPLCLIALSARGQSPAAKPTPAQIQAEKSRLQAARRSNERDVAAVRRDIAALQLRLVQLAANEESDEGDNNGKRDRLMLLNAQEEEMASRLDANRNTLARLLGALELYRRDPPPALLVHPDSARDAVRAVILVRAMAPELQRRGRVLGVQVAEIERVRRDVAATSEDLFQSDSALAEQRAGIEALIARKQALERSLLADADAADQALAALASDAGSVGELINRLGLGVQTDLAAAPAPGFLAPVQGQVVRRFGQATAGGPSQGWSYRTAPGALVRAPTGGLVEYAGPLDGYGAILILRVGGGYHLVVTGLGAVQTAVGSAVRAGEPVGRMADRAEGTAVGAAPRELYLEVRKDGAPVDPAPWLRPVAAPSRAAG